MSNSASTSDSSRHQNMAEVPTKDSSGTRTNSATSTDNSFTLKTGTDPGKCYPSSQRADDPAKVEVFNNEANGVPHAAAKVPMNSSAASYGSQSKAPLRLAPETGIGQRETGIGQRETGIGQRETGIGQRETGIGQRKTGIGQRETGIGQRETGIGQRETGIGQRETGIGQREAGIEQREAGIGQRDRDDRNQLDIPEDKPQLCPPPKPRRLQPVSTRQQEIPPQDGRENLLNSQDVLAGNFKDGVEEIKLEVTESSQQINCHLVPTNHTEASVYCHLHGDSKERQLSRKKNARNDFLFGVATPKDQNSSASQESQLSPNKNYSCLDENDGDRMNLIQISQITFENSCEPMYLSPVTRKRTSLRSSRKIINALGAEEYKKIHLKVFDEGGQEKFQEDEVNASNDEAKALDETQPTHNEVSGAPEEEQKILLPSVIAEARQRTQTSRAQNRYTFRSPYTSPTRTPVTPRSAVQPHLLSADNHMKMDTFGSLQRKLRNSMRKIGAAKPQAPDPCMTSLTGFLDKEKEYSKSLERIMASMVSYEDCVIVEYFNALGIIKSSCDEIIDYISKRSLSVTTLIEAFYKQIEQLKIYTSVMKEARNIEVASYKQELRDLRDLLEKLVGVNDRLSYYCMTFQTWLQLLPNEDNLSELRYLIDLLEQIRLNGLIPDCVAEDD